MASSPEATHRALTEAARALRSQREAGTLGEGDDDLRERIAALGFAGDAARAFDLVPLLHVAWADAEVQPGERATIATLLRIRGVSSVRAQEIVEALLHAPPDPVFVDEAMEVLRALVRKHGGQDQARTVVGLCVLVAEAAGGFLGLFDPVSAAERRTIEDIASRLGAAAQAELRARLG
jgi:tellurite resistance protein